MSKKAPNRWAKIKMGITSPVHPCFMLWPSSSKHLPQLRSILLGPMLFTLSIWKRCSERFSLSSLCPPFSSVLFNPEIPDSLSFEWMLPWTQAGVFHLRHLVNPVTCRCTSFFQISKWNTRSLRHYLQFKHYFSIKSLSLSLEKHTSFELLCVNGPYEPQLILSIYKILHNAVPLTDSTHKYIFLFILTHFLWMGRGTMGGIWGPPGYSLPADPHNHSPGFWGRNPCPHQYGD